MVLDREDHRVIGRLERVLFYVLDDVEEADLGGQRVAVVDERHPVRSVPAVQLDAPAAHVQAARVRLHARLARKLVARQVPAVTVPWQGRHSVQSAIMIESPKAFQKRFLMITRPSKQTALWERN